WSSDVRSSDLVPPQPSLPGGADPFAASIWNGEHGTALRRARCTYDRFRPLLACSAPGASSSAAVSPPTAFSTLPLPPFIQRRRGKRAGRVEPTPHARPSAPLPSPPPTGGPRTWSQRSTGLRRSFVADCVCDPYGGCCDDARQREYARTFGPSVSTASANGVDYRPLLGRVGADGPD